MTIRRVVLLVVLPLVGVAGLLVLAAQRTDAERSIDLSGNWYVAINGEDPPGCAAEIVQSGGELSMDVSCPGLLGDGTFEGTIDSKTGAFTATGVLVFHVSVSGTAAADGQSFSGNWSAETGVTGTFEGARDAPAPGTPVPSPVPGGSAGSPIDVTGTWKIEAIGLASDTDSCIAHVVQEGDSVSIELDCRLVGSFALVGTIDSTTGNFTAIGDFYGLDIAFFGSASDDSLHGNISYPNVWGSFRGTRILPTPTPWPTPTVGPLDLTGDWIITLDGRNFPRPASGGFSPCVVYLEQNEPAVAGGIACKLEETAVRIDGTVNVAGESMGLNWEDPGFGSFELEGSRSEDGRELTGTYTLSLLPEVTNSFTMTRTFANYWGSITCQSVGPLPRSRVINGSLAALYALGLQDRIPSSYYSCVAILDVNVNGEVDALDALLILQREAGLIPRLPVL